MNITINKNIIVENPETKSFLADAYFQETENKLPLVIFSHGYKGYKDWGAWDLMAKKFAEQGFYFVKFNFSYNGITLENPLEFNDLEAFGNNNFSKEMSDFKAAITHFSNEKNVDTSNISIIGHSRGGGIAIIEAFEDERVHKLITFAGVSNFKTRFPRDDRFEKWKQEGVMYSENMRTHQKMPHFFQYYEDYKNNETRFDIQRAAQNLKKPFLIVQGTNDEAVNQKEALLLLNWNKNSELFLIENANHVFGSKEPWTSNELPKDLEVVINHTVDFINNN